LRNVAISALFFLSGCPVAAESAEIWPVNGVFTHFPKDERFDGDGRFADERRRVDEIMKIHGGNSLVLLNETYSTTNEELALKCTSELAEALFSSGCFGIYITHQHRLAGTKIPFLSVIVDESDANRRTFRIEKLRSAAGSYAEDILRRYRLTKDALAARFANKKG
jgi:DNA mismatch repair ATPase MutS